MSFVIATLGATMLPLLLNVPNRRFHPTAKQNIDSFLQQEIVGQDLALFQLTAAVKNHLSLENPISALVISVHGPPGVGKSFTHYLMAKALFNKNPSSPKIQCPGDHCSGYKVVMGVDFSQACDDDLRRTLLTLEAHIEENENSLIVLEEYDKMKCSGRRILRFLAQNPDIKHRKSIIILESNAGFEDIIRLRYDVLRKAAIEADESSSPVFLPSYNLHDYMSPEQAESSLKSSVSKIWASQSCESYVDTLRYINLVKYFLPYMPLSRHDIKLLMGLEIQHRWENNKMWDPKDICKDIAGKKIPCNQALLKVDDIALDWLVDKIHFGRSNERVLHEEGSGKKGKDSEDTERMNALKPEVRNWFESVTSYPLEGASQVPQKVTLYVQRLFEHYMKSDGDSNVPTKFRIKLNKNQSQLLLIRL